MTAVCECGHPSSHHVGRDDPDRREDCPCLDCHCGDFLEDGNATADRALRVQKILLTKHRVVIQRLLLALDQMRGVAECAPQDIKSTYNFEAMEGLRVEANRVIMLNGEDVRIG